MEIEKAVEVADEEKKSHGRGDIDSKILSKQKIIIQLYIILNKFILLKYQKMLNTNNIIPL